MSSDVFESTRSRPVGLKMRSDLHVVKQVYRHEVFYLIKDPLEMEFYRLNAEEFFILTLLDGKHSLEDIKEEFERSFSPQRIRHRQLQTYIADLRKKSLLAFLGTNVGPAIVERQNEKRVEKLKKNLSNVLSLKWRGVDPDRFLSAITPVFGGFFHPVFVAFSVTFICSALIWLLVHWAEFQARLPGLSQFLAQENWLTLGLAIVFMKIVHELAHGVAFKRYGGECHEIGVMLIMLIIPTLYCSTTDSWLLKSKWKRATIGFAGIYVELFLAACATFIWWSSVPGTLNSLCLNVMATGAVSALLMNANPFFKLDGYYIFSDIFELPNLRERAGKYTQSVFLKRCLGIEESCEQNSTASTKRTLLVYQVLAFVVKILVVVLIKFTLIDRLNEYGLGYVALAVGIMSISALVLPPLWSLYKFFKVPGRMQRIEFSNASMLMIGTAGCVTLVCFVPFPHYVTCPLTIQMRNERSVYVEHAARLKEVFVESGQRVNPGDPIAQLESHEDELELQRLSSELRSVEAELELLDQTREPSLSTPRRASELREIQSTTRAKIQKLSKIVESFSINASASGQVVPAWKQLEAPNDDDLKTFDGVILSEKNVGSWLESGTKICSIGELKEFDAVLAVNEHDVSFIRQGNEAQILLDSFSDERIHGIVADIAKKESDDVPRSLAKESGGSIEGNNQAKPNTKASQRPSDEHFEARVPLPENEFKLSTGLRGNARIRVGSKTLLQRLVLLVNRSFRKRLM